MKSVREYAVIFLVFFLGTHINAQDDLLDELDTTTENQSFESPAFKAMRIANLQSTKIAAKGDLYFYVSHRFGTLQNGIDTFFGFDNANTRIQFAYSFWEGVQFSISRESLRKTYTGAIKYRLARQSGKFPVTVVGYNSININTEINENTLPNITFSDRYSFGHQLLISRRFSKSFSFEIAPTYIRENVQDVRVTGTPNHNQFALGFGGRYKLSKRVSLNADYAYNFSRNSNSIYNNPLTIGVDIETGGHVFQLLFSNAQSTTVPGFMSNAEGDWSKGNVFFGFNIVRVF
ncbi:MAG: hypothetical protein GKR88_00220 [Flavobacteriaceae bacterium]|nr:MAG: hypothetical protein GKR88_00220 [Flavobacteriaceae bacterium]